MITGKIHGLAAVEKMLQDLPDKEAKKVLRSSLMRGALPLLRAIQAAAPVRDDGSGPKKLSKKSSYGRMPGWLRSNIGRKFGGVTATSVSVGITFRRAWYWHLVEFGSRHARARPFIRPAAESAQGAAVADLAAAFGPQIEKAARRIALKQFLSK